jgi:hypothetical protein
LPAAERRRAHQALADVTDPAADPDRRTWHRALAAAGPDEDLAEELERSASRAQARGGLAAAAAFLERATALTPDAARRGFRAVAAAQAKVHAGAFAAGLDLLATAEAGPLGELEHARADLARAQLAFATQPLEEAAARLLQAVTRLERTDASVARATYLDALVAAIFARRLAGPAADVLAVARAAGEAPPPPHSPSAADLLLDGLVANFTEGYTAGVAVLRNVLMAFGGGMPADRELRWLSVACPAAYHVWDDEGWRALSDRYLPLARDLGALSELPIALAQRAFMHLFAGELDAAASLVEEAQAATEATGTNVGPCAAIALATLRGDASGATALIDATLRDMPLRGEGVGISVAEWANAVLNNSLGRYAEG